MIAAGPLFCNNKILWSFCFTLFSIGYIFFAEFEVENNKNEKKIFIIIVMSCYI